MSRTTLKLLVAGAILVSALGYLAYAGMKEGWASYHLPVDTFVDGAQYQNERVRLAGTVAEEGIEQGAGRLGVKFVLLGEKRKLAVSYGGVVPEMFKAGGDVIVEGRRDSSGVFRAEVLMTKCASKYEAKAHPNGKKAENGK